MAQSASLVLVVDCAGDKGIEYTRLAMVEDFQISADVSFHPYTCLAKQCVKRLARPVESIFI